MQNSEENGVISPVFVEW